MTAARRHARSTLTLSGPRRVPEITPTFWVIKGLTTAMGEAASDYFVHAINPEVAVIGGFLVFVGALALQLRAGRYVAWTYWLAVSMVGVFGTMAADVLHVAFGVPYVASSLLYIVILAAVFVAWYRTERTLSIHAIDTTRRELFYWAAVVATFAMGTALGDLTAYTLNLGYFTSAAIFAILILIPAVAYGLGRWTPVLCFWSAYVMTRPLGASLADGFGKPASVSGLGLGDGAVAAVLALAIIALVVWVSVTHRDVQEVPAALRADLAADPGTARR